uniref:Putative ribonuclease H-like domain-containing protein n=1 Tax=Tanacetum cinerariifolium TaxID=118510 RepID=A0A6L2K145_TANCI|nr:putative ribonuclease H-like domain-containing protein [Tanacetum cinerariifolium]
MESQSKTTQTVSALKLLVLKTREYDLWSMRMDQYLTFTGHALWEVIVNGDSVSSVASTSAEGPIPPKTAKQKLAGKNKLKAKSTLMLSILDEHLLKFHACKDAKSLWEEIKNSTNETINTAHSVSAASSKDQASNASYADDVKFSFFFNQSNSPQLENEDLEQIDTDDLEEIDLKWQVAMLTIRVKRKGHFARECRAPRNQGNRNRDAPTRNAPVDTSTTNALVVQDGIGGYDWSFQTEEELTNFALMAYTSQGSSSLDFEISVIDMTGLGYDGQINESDLNDIHVNECEVLNNVFDSHESDGDDNQVNDRFKKGEGYHAVPPPYTGNYMPPRADLSFAGLDNSVFKSKGSEAVTSEWESASEDENVFKPKEVKKIVKPSLEKIEFVNARNTTVENEKKATKEIGMGKITGPKKIRTVWDNTTRVNHQNKLTHPHLKRNFVPAAILTKSEQVLVNAAKQSSHRPAASVSAARRVNIVAHLPVNSVTARPKAVVSAAEGNRNNAINSSPCWIWRPKGNLTDHISKESRSYTLKRFNYVDPQGRLKHMTGNKFYLIDYQEIDGGFVAFGGNARGKITGKGKIRTGKLDFQYVYFVKELKFNLFSVSQMCDKKNSVLFIETECVVLSPDFKLLDESQVFLKVSRNNNMYSFDLKNVVPVGGLTCLFTKATLDESNLWHRRLGHINFKTMNKLVRGNLVRGLPSKLFKNDHTCVACQKKKQHKASCKTKTVSSICKPLQLLHMDLFGSVSIKSINKKAYCLVVTDDFSRFNWVFFLTTKDETPEILKNFIVGRKPTLRFMRPFGCLVIILNTLDHLGTKENIDAGQAGKKTVPGPQYVLLPLLTFDSQGPKSSEDEVADDVGNKSTKVPIKENGVQDPAKEGDKNDQDKDLRDQEEALRK